MNSVPQAFFVRCPLFVPGDQPERFAKAMASDADSVIIDLEDAVAPDDKAHARASIAAFLETNTASSDTRTKPIIVRINAVSDAAHADDMSMLSVNAPDAIMLPKATLDASDRLSRNPPCPVIALVETATAFTQLDAICAQDRIVQLALGNVDLCTDLGLVPGTPGGRAILDSLRTQLIVQSRAAELAAPLDGVFTDVKDLSGFEAAAERARQSGMAGLLCIHPTQCMAARRALQPSASDTAWAHAVLEEAKTHKGAFTFDGQMVDTPVLARARRLIAAEEPQPVRVQQD